MVLNEFEMAKMSSKDVENNFIALAITPWHAHGIDASLMLLEEQGVNLRGIIFICTFVGRKKVLAPSNFIYKKDGIRFVECEFEESSWKSKIQYNFNALCYLVQNKRHKYLGEFYVLNTLFPNLIWLSLFADVIPNKKIIYIITDEGSGSYITSKKNIWITQHFSKDQTSITRFMEYIKLMLLSCMRKIIRKIGDYLLHDQNRYCNNFLFLTNKKTGKLYKNETIIGKYKIVFEKHAHTLTVPLENKILINTQPLMESSIVTSDEALWERILEAVQSRNIPIVLKPHPSEKDAGKYLRIKDIEIIQEKCSQEQMITENNMPVCVIGPYSTTLITLTLFWNILAISLAYLYLAEGKINKRFIETIRTFIEIFNGIIKFPKNIGEFESMLDEILQSLGQRDDSGKKY